MVSISTMEWRTLSKTRGEEASLDEAYGPLNVAQDKYVESIKALEAKAEQARNASRHPNKSGVVPPYYNQLSDAGLINQSTAGSFEDMFKPPRFENAGQAIAMNAGPATAKNAKSSNKTKGTPFTDFDTPTTLGVMKLQPQQNPTIFTKERDAVVMDSTRNLELFTGMTSEWKKKQEIVPMFKPNENIQSVNGAPNVTDLERERYIPSIAREGERPFEPVKVTPGVGLGANEDKIKGIRGTDDYRIEYKSVDELRAANKQKETYEGRVLPGRLGEKRTIDPNMVKRRPDTFKVQSVDDLAPNKAAYTKPTQREQINNKIGNRAVNMQLIGPANAAFKNVKDVAQDGKVAAPKRRQEHNAEYGNTKAPVAVWDPNSNSFIIPTQQRHYTKEGEFGLNLGATNQGTLVHNGDISRTTQRQGMQPFDPNIGGTVTAPRAYDNREARPTGKQDVATQQLNSTLTGPSAGYASIQDDARATTKSSTLDPFNTNIGTNTGTYVGQLDDARATGKQNIAATTYNANPVTKTVKNPTTGLLDDVKHTLKETTIHQEYQAPANRANETKINTFTAPQATHRQTAHVEYIPTANRNNAHTNYHYSVDPTMRQVVHYGGYMQAASAAVAPSSQGAERAADVNIVREQLVRGRAPTKVGAVSVPDASIIGEVNVSELPNAEYQGPAGSVVPSELDERIMLGIQRFKDNPYFDSRIADNMLIMLKGPHGMYGARFTGGAEALGISTQGLGV